jgi:predicted Abi (CAAX) family protease
MTIHVLNASRTAGIQFPIGDGIILLVTTTRPHREPTQNSVQLVRTAFPQNINRPDREADLSSVYTAEAGICGALSHFIYLSSVKGHFNFTFITVQRNNYLLIILKELNFQFYSWIV